MKTNAIVRIVIYSLVIVLLTGILIFGLTFTFDSGNYIEGSGVVAANSVHTLKIQWTSGTVTIQTAATDTITFQESGYSAEDRRMAYEHANGTLSIRYSKSASFMGISIFSSQKKDLTITIPEDWSCTRLEIESASADVTIQNLTATDVDIDSASGEYRFINCTVKSLEADTASGTIRYTGSLEALDCDAASANFIGTFTNVPSNLSMDSASGYLDITLPENCGFRVEIDAASGKFTSDFDTTMQGDAYLHGDGRCFIEFDGASGSVHIRKGS